MITCSNVLNYGCRQRTTFDIFTYFTRSQFWLMHVDCSSSRPQDDDTLRHAQWFSGRRSGWSHDAEVLSLWWHGQRCQSHGVHWKTYVDMKPWFSGLNTDAVFYKYLPLVSVYCFLNVCIPTIIIILLNSLSLELYTTLRCSIWRFLFRRGVLWLL